MTVESNLNTIKNLLFAFLFVLILYLLKVLSSILIPLVLALLIAMMFQPLVAFLQKFKTPKILIFPVVTIITLAILFLIYTILNETITSIISNQDYLINRLSVKLQYMVDWVNNAFGTNYVIDKSSLRFSKLLDSTNLSNFVGSVANALGSFTGSFIMFTLYYIILLVGMTEYDKYLSYVKGESEAGFIEDVNTIQSSIFSYMMIKTMISLSTAILVYITCLLFNLDFAFFWAFLAFLLNYIPTIGSITASIPPVLMAFIQFDSFQPVFFLLIAIASIQIIMGNLIEPIIMGDRLKLNTLTVIFGLVFWGYIWGVPGMIVSIPLLVLLKLIFEHFPSTQIFARIMGSPD